MFVILTRLKYSLAEELIIAWLSPSVQFPDQKTKPVMLLSFPCMASLQHIQTVSIIPLLWPFLSKIKVTQGCPKSLRPRHLIWQLSGYLLNSRHSMDTVDRGMVQVLPRQSNFNMLSQQRTIKNVEMISNISQQMFSSWRTTEARAQKRENTIIFFPG